MEVERSLFFLLKIDSVTFGIDGNWIGLSYWWWSDRGSFHFLASVNNTSGRSLQRIRVTRLLTKKPLKLAIKISRPFVRWITGVQRDFKSNKNRSLDPVNRDDVFLSLAAIFATSYYCYYIGLILRERDRTMLFFKSRMYGTVYFIDRKVQRLFFRSNE